MHKQITKLSPMTWVIIGVFELLIEVTLLIFVIAACNKKEEEKVRHPLPENAPSSIEYNAIYESDLFNSEEN